MSQQDVDSYVQLPHFVEKYEHKKTGEGSPCWDINEVNGAEKYSLALSLGNTQIEILNWVWISA